MREAESLRQFRSYRLVLLDNFSERLQCISLCWSMLVPSGTGGKQNFRLKLYQISCRFQHDLNDFYYLQVKPSNHATVQSIVHELNLTPGIGRPCCVPTMLLPISLLYYDNHDNVVLKQYPDMVADSCGCL